MTKAERVAYLREVRIVAKRLGLSATGDPEAAILQECIGKVRALMATHGAPATLSELLARVATCLNLEIVEIEGADDFKKLFERIPPHREPVLARVPDELDHRTDAVVLQRQHREGPWDMPYLAIINCRGYHGYRRYFSKWHEVVHLLLDGNQLSFAFRKTGEDHKHPEEILVDKIAGELAFHPDIFTPVLNSELRSSRLGFDAIERVRGRVAAEASRLSTVLACVRRSDALVWFLRAGLGYKKQEERQMSGLFGDLDDVSAPTQKLRVKQTVPSNAATALSVRLHQNMEVPLKSVITDAFQGSERRIYFGTEELQMWKTSNGAVGSGRIVVEAIRYGQEVWAIITAET